MAVLALFKPIIKIWLAFTGFMYSLFSKSRKHEDDAKPPILPLTANKPVTSQDVSESARMRMEMEAAASLRNFVAAGMLPYQPYYEYDPDFFIRDIPLPQSPMDYPPSHTGSSNPLSKSTITSLYTSFAATKYDSSSSQSFNASRDMRSDRRKAKCGSILLLDRSPKMQEIVLDVKRASLVNFNHSVVQDSEDDDTGLTNSNDGMTRSGAASCETYLADNESTEALEPCPDKPTKSSELVSRDVIVDFAGLSTYPFSALSASSTCAFSDIPPSGDRSAGAECVALPTTNAAGCDWTSGVPLSPEQQQCKGRISLTPYPEGMSMTMDFGSPDLANLKATLEAIKLLDEPPTGIEVDEKLSVHHSSMATETNGDNTMIKVEEQLSVHHSSMAAENNGDKIPLVAPEPGLVFLQVIPTPGQDPTRMVDNRSGKENDTPATQEVPRGDSPTEDKAKRKPLSTVAIGSTAEKADIRDRDRYRGAAYSRVLPKPCLSASSSMTSIVLATVPPFVPSPVLQDAGTPPLVTGVFVSSASLSSSQGQFKSLGIRVVHDMTFGTPRGFSFDSKDINAGLDDRTVCFSGKARRRRSILQCSMPNPNANNGVRAAKGNLHEKSKSLSKSTGCQVKASTSGGLVK